MNLEVPLCQVEVHSIFYQFLNGQVQQVLTNPALLHMLSFYTRSTLLIKKRKYIHETGISSFKKNSDES